jgi:hypothetical protein
MKGFTLFAVLCVFCVSCTQEHDETGGEIDTYSYSDSSVDDTATNTSPVELDSSSETQEGIDTGKHRDTDTTEDTQYRTPGGKDTTEGDTETTEGSGEEDSESIQDTGLPGQTDRDTGSDSESGTGEVDTVPEEESDTPLDTTPQNTDTTDTGSEVVCTCEGYEKYNPVCIDYCKEKLYPCFPTAELFNREECCNCVSDPAEVSLFCNAWCAEQNDTGEEPDTDTDPQGECIYEHKKCSDDGRSILRCDDPNDLVWVKKTDCTDFESCYMMDDGWPECVRDQLGELGPCPDNIQGYEVCVRGYDVNWIKKCEHNQWRLKDTCEGDCIPLEDTWFPAFECE